MTYAPGLLYVQLGGMRHAQAEGLGMEGLLATPLEGNCFGAISQTRMAHDDQL